MIITVDFLEFAVKSCTVEAIIHFLNFDNVDFCDTGIFNVNYKRSKTLKGFCKIGYDNDTSIYDVYVSLSGSGCRLLEDYNSGQNFSWFDFISSLMSSFDVSFRRIDIAIDDHTDLLNTHKLWFRYYKKGKFAGACRSVPKYIEGREEELIFGSPQSDYLIRIYNKGLERGFIVGEKILNTMTGELVDHWWRLEQQIRGHKSEQFINEWLKAGSESLGEISCGYILEFIRFLTRPNDKTNSQRIPVCDWWLNFLNQAHRIKFTSKPGTVYNAHKLDSWLNTQVASSIKTYIHLFGLTPEDLYQHFDSSDIILNNSQRALLRAKAYRLSDLLEKKSDELLHQSELPFGPELKKAFYLASSYESEKQMLDLINRVLDSLKSQDNQYIQLEMSDEYE